MIKKIIIFASGIYIYQQLNKCITNNYVKMKKKNFMLIACAAALFTACDPEGDVDAVMHNSTDLKVTVLAAHTPQINFEIQPGKELVVEGLDVLGGASREMCEWAMSDFLSDSVVFSFDNGYSTVFHKGDTSSLSPYNFNSKAYSYSDSYSTGFMAPKEPTKGKLVYKILPEMLPTDSPD